MTTIAGGSVGYLNGIGASAKFDMPTGIIVDSSGNLYIGDGNNNVIRKITTGGVVSTFAGSGSLGNQDGNGTNALFHYPFDITIDSAGNLYAAIIFNHNIRKISPTGLVSTLAGSNSSTASSNGYGYLDSTGTLARFNQPKGITIDSSGNLYVADYINAKIRKVTPEGVVSTISGSSVAQGIAVDSSGNLYVADNHVIKKVTPAGVVSVLAGSSAGYLDGQGASAKFNLPVDIAVDPAGNLYVADGKNYKIRKISPNGTVSTIATQSFVLPSVISGGMPFDGALRGITIDSKGNIYITESIKHTVQKITPICSSGAFYSLNSSSCVSCEAAIDSDGCSKCPAGQFGSSNSSDCSPCPAGQYSYANSTSCSLCPAGQSSQAGSSYCSSITVVNNPTKTTSIASMGMINTTFIYGINDKSNL